MGRGAGAGAFGGIWCASECEGVRRALAWASGVGRLPVVNKKVRIIYFLPFGTKTSSRPEDA